MLDGEASAAAALLAASHLRDCPGCREAAARIVGCTQALKSAPLEDAGPAWRRSLRSPGLPQEGSGACRLAGVIRGTPDKSGRRRTTDVVSPIARRGVSIMRVGLGLTAVLALGVALALGLTGTSAAPVVVSSENAVVHSSGVAPSAIVAAPNPTRRAPASNSVPRRKVYDAVTANEPKPPIGGSSAFTHVAE